VGRRAKPSGEEDKYVTKGGLKLEFALEHFGILVDSKIVADLGSHQGGFVDCLLAHKAQKVYSVDTCYGTLAWSLRQNPKVVVCERTNALYWRAPEPLELITIDVGWTRQEYIIPIAMRSLQTGGAVLSLLKPQYEVRFHASSHGVLSEGEAEDILRNTLVWLGPKFAMVSWAISPYRGSGGNVEMWLYLRNPTGNFATSK
jgi:23S rRNA (cytidine1920-2'-O)/16S rRNA (cytidine1409-2'-O)-methyltransferase